MFTVKFTHGGVGSSRIFRYIYLPKNCDLFIHLCAGSEAAHLLTTKIHIQFKNNSPPLFVLTKNW